MQVASLRRLAAAVALVVAPFVAHGQDLVADINQVPGVDLGSDPEGFLVVGNSVYFAADREGLGQELWVYDGSGVELVADIVPGPASSRPFDLVDLGNGTVFFAAKTGWQWEPWRLDIASGTTQKLQAIWPGILEPSSPVVFQGEVFFIANDGAHGRELWKSDGTAAGTKLFVDLFPGPFSGVVAPAVASVVSGGKLFFAGTAAPAERRLWVTDGTVASLVPVGPVGWPRFLTDAGGTLFYGLEHPDEGRELWSTDGTPAGTGLVVDLNPTGPSNPRLLTPLGNELLFVADAAGAGWSLWRTDGTAAGTQLVLDLAPDGQNDEDYYTMTPFGAGALFWIREDVSSPSVEKVTADLWFTDGTPAGTRILLDQTPTAHTELPSDLVVSGGNAYFANGSTATGTEVWITDGATSVVPLAELLPGAGSGVPDFEPGKTAVPFLGGVLLAAQDQPDDQELWFTGSITGQVAEVNPALGSAPSDPRHLTRLGDVLVFQADDGVHGTELWTSDGTAAGTVLVSDISPGPGGSDPGPFHVHGDRVFFAANGIGGRHLWVSDGTATGTQLATDLLAHSYLECCESLGDRVVFRRSSDLYATDGTPSGTVKIAPIVGSFEVLGDYVYFAGEGATHGREIFRSDGSPGSAELAFELVPGPADMAGPWELTGVDGQLFFVGGETFEELLLYRGDPQTGAVVAIANQHVGSVSGIEGLTPVGSELYYASDDPTAGYELYRTDGTTQTLVADLAPGPKDGYFGSPAVVGGRLLFLGDDNGSLTLLATDGTAPTPISTGVYAGPFGGAATSLSVPGTSDVALFPAKGVPPAGLGFEAWVTDGTATGTQLVFDLAAGLASSHPDEFVRVGDRLFFTADAGLGRELHVAPFTLSGGSAWDTIGLGCPDAAGRFASIALAGDPTLGATVGVELEGAAPNAVALLLAGFDPDPVDLGGCVLHAGPLFALAGLEVTDASGEAVNPLVIPGAPALVGLPVVLQWVALDPGGTFAGVGGSTPGLELITSS